jgi:short-subunit dehydrogenase
MSDTKKPVILITGASTGLGLSLARKLGSLPYHLVLTAREKSLSRFASEGIAESDNVWIRALDVTNDSERRSLIAEIEQALGGVDVLINNAGFTYRSVLEHVEQDELLQQMITNFWAPMELVRLVLPTMRRKRSGRIVNVSSVGGMMAMPTMAVYSASKFALEGASESLYYELKPWNILVTLIEPGFIRSDSFQNVRYTTLSGTSMRDPSEAYFGHYRFMTEFIKKLMMKAPGNLDDIVRKVVFVIRQKNPPLRVAATPDAVFFDLLRRFLPRKLYHWVLYRNLPFPDCWGDEDRLRDRCKIQRLS